ncbi:SDR family oxidoreductase [Anoxynatronum sibiricum]|uniref:SDR family oxidoreductase n=1 Tax=Anoxynatronum sibiricum TaxID=210623 RepID=A0ABU9W0X1_9CLOT
MRSERRTVVVTGASSGIGYETVRRFMEEGDTVYCISRNEKNLHEVLESLRELPGKALALAGDVSKVSECQQMMREVELAGNGLDVLVNAAGVWKDGPSDTMTEAVWDEVMDINAKGTFFMCRYALPLLEAREGVIVNVSSDSGLVGNKEAAIYCASKGAVTLMTKALAVELAERGVRVNAVCPGDVATPMLEKAFQESDFDDRHDYEASLLAHYPLGDRARFTQPEEVAEAIFFLASNRVKAMTGTCLSVDFGLTAGY